jgi:hypothetical protein
MSESANESNRSFIITQPLGKAGETGERIVADRLGAAFKDRTCKGFAPYHVFSKDKKIRWEPDILIADREFGLIIIEVKSIRIDEIVALEGPQWRMKPDFYNYGHYLDIAIAN